MGLTILFLTPPTYYHYRILFHHMTMKIICCNSHKPSRRPKTSALVESQLPKAPPNTKITLLMWSCTIKPKPIGLGLPIEDPSKLSSKIPLRECSQSFRWDFYLRGNREYKTPNLSWNHLRIHPWYPQQSIAKNPHHMKLCQLPPKDSSSYLQRFFCTSLYYYLPSITSIPLWAWNIAHSWCLE